MAEEKAKAAEEIPESSDSETGNQVAEAMQFLFNWNSEIVRFYTQRYQKDGALSVSLMSCTNPADVLQVQRDFVEQLVSDYRDEVAKLSEIAGGLGRQMVESLGAGYGSYEAELQKAQADAAAIVDEAKAQAERILVSAEEHAKKLMEAPAAPEAPEEPETPEEPAEKQA